MIIELALAVGAFGIYWKSLNGSLCGDDHAVLGSNAVQSGDWRACLLGPPVEGLRAKLRGFFLHSIRARGLVNASYALDFKLAERDALDATRLSHFVNITLHGVTTATVYHLLQTLGLAPRAALLGAAYWLVNPLMVNAVANIAGRGSLLAAVFSLGALLAALSGLHELALPAIALAFLSKQDSVITLPLTGILLLWFGQVSGFVYLALAAIAAFAARNHFKAQTGNVISKLTGWPPPMPLARFAPTFLVATLQRLPKWFLGFGHGFSPSVLEITWRGSLPYLALALLTAALVLAWNIPLLTLVLLLVLFSPWMCYVLTPMPDVVLEHRAYMLGLPAALLIGTVSPLIPLWILTAWFGLLVARSRHRAAQWTFGALNKAAIEDGSEKPMVFLNRGSELLALRPVDEAEALTRRALALAPNVYHGWGQLGSIASLRRDPINSYRNFRRGAFRCPMLPIAWSTFGRVCEGFGLTARAMACYRHVERTNASPEDKAAAKLLLEKVRLKHASIRHPMAPDLPDSTQDRLPVKVQ